MEISTFMAHVGQLKTLTSSAVGGAQTYSKKDRIDRDDPTNYPVPFKMESQMADDLAFLAASREGAKHVTAVAIQQNHQDPRLTAVVAANEQIPPPVGPRFLTMMNTMRKRAKKEISLDECRSQLLDSVVGLSATRIHGRLQSSRWSPPSHVRREIQPLKEWLKEKAKILEDQTVSNKNKRKMIRQLSEHFKVLERLIVKMEITDTKTESDHLKQILIQAYSLSTCDGRRSLEQTIKDRTITAIGADSNHVRRIDKLGNYWRICRSFAKNCQEHPASFSSVGLQLVPLCVGVQPLPQNASKVYHVHAEVQLLVHYERHPCDPLPRALGTSKSACYLCDLVIKYHGNFYVSRTHGQIFEQWTVPVLEANTAQYLKFQKILRDMDNVITREIRLRRLRSGRRLFLQHQNQSVLFNDPSSAASISPPPSTVLSVTSQSDFVQLGAFRVGPNTVQVHRQRLPSSLALDDHVDGAINSQGASSGPAMSREISIAQTAPTIRPDHSGNPANRDPSTLPSSGSESGPPDVHPKAVPKSPSQGLSRNAGSPERSILVDRASDQSSPVSISSQARSIPAPPLLPPSPPTIQDPAPEPTDADGRSSSAATVTKLSCPPSESPPGTRQSTPRAAHDTHSISVADLTLSKAPSPPPLPLSEISLSSNDVLEASITHSTPLNIKAGLLHLELTLEDAAAASEYAQSVRFTHVTATIRRVPRNGDTTSLVTANESQYVDVSEMRPGSQVKLARDVVTQDPFVVRFHLQEGNDEAELVDVALRWEIGSPGHHDHTRINSK
ncbi:MAG: hypothetical protein M4579_001193 [Chaenotheca gracillima]|nr:MAG: hypothetical protein M4579_001193 [Chaenotheca gracillima]